MRNPIWFFAAFLTSVTVSAETAVSSFDVTYSYYDKNSTCTQSVIDTLPLTLKFDRLMDDHLLLVSTETKNTDLGKPVQFTKEGTKGYIAYMSTGSTVLTVDDAQNIEEEHLLQQLWLQKKEKRHSPLLSAFYLSTSKNSQDKDCLIMNDPAAGEEYPSELRWSGQSIRIVK